MSMPKKISSWLMILYFLVVGLGAFVSSIAGMTWLAGILALGTAVFLFIDK